MSAGTLEGLTVKHFVKMLLYCTQRGSWGCSIAHKARSVFSLQKSAQVSENLGILTGGW